MFPIHAKLKIKKKKHIHANLPRHSTSNIFLSLETNNIQRKTLQFNQF